MHISTSYQLPLIPFIFPNNFHINLEAFPLDESALVSFCSYKSVHRNNKIKNPMYNCGYTLNKVFDVYKARRKENAALVKKDPSV